MPADIVGLSAAARSRAWTGGRLPYVIVAIFAVLPGVVSHLPTPIYRFYVAEWGLTPFEVTAIFGVHVIGVALALLFLGGISDQIGRRPVMIVAFPLLLVTLLLFVLANGIVPLLVARILQGLVTGLVTSAAAASLAELHVRGDVDAAGRYVGLIGPIGMALAVAASTAMVELAPYPTTLPYVAVVLPLLVGFALLVLLVPETVLDRSRVRLRMQRVAVPAEVRPVFLAASAGGVATWAVAGLYLSLGPQLTTVVVGDDRAVLGGVAVVAFIAAGILGQRVTRRISTTSLTLAGCVGLSLGVAITVVGVRAGNVAAFAIGTALSGFCWLLPFLGGMRQVAAAAPAARRAEAMSGFLLIGFVALGVPAAVVGAAITRWGLVDAHTGFGLAVTLVLVAVGVMTGRLARQPASSLSPERP